MSRARIEAVPPGCPEARDHIATARRMRADAGLAGLSPEARLTLLYDAGRNAASAVLRAHGRRVTAGLGAHQVAIAEAGRLLGADGADAARRLERARRVRHDVEYGNLVVSGPQADALAPHVDALIAAATAEVQRRCP